MLQRLALVLLAPLALLGCLDGWGPTEDPGADAAALTSVTKSCVADAQVYEASPATNYGTSGTAGLKVGAPARKESLYGFGSGAIGLPAGAIVTSATLGITIYTGGASGAGTVEAHAPTTAWTETSATWNNAGTAFDPAVIGSTSIAAGQIGTYGVNVTSLVQSWVNGGANNGVLLLETGGASSVVGWAREAPTPANRPTLAITYLTPCSDGVQGQAESDVDCGGGTCGACANGKHCGTGADCTSGACVGSVCVNGCSDALKDGAESDVDCGGAACAKCSDGKACGGNADCASGICSVGVCISCADTIKNGSESDIDCGGACATKCPLDGACNVPGDCASGVCGGGLCRPVGGEAISVVTTCAYGPDLSIVATSYSYGSDPTNLISIWIPVGAAPPAGWASVGFVHGGGGTSDGGGRASAAFIYYGQSLAARGIAAWSIDYRLMSGTAPNVVNPYPAAVNDGVAALAWVQSNAATLGLDPARVGVAGFSFGGHLSARMAQTGGIKRQACWYCNLYWDQPTWWSASNPSLWQYLGVTGQSDPTFPAKSAAANLVPAWADPPALLIHSQNDATVSAQMSTRFATAAHNAGNPATAIIIPNVNAHGFTPTSGGAALPSTCTAFALWDEL